MIAAHPRAEWRPFPRADEQSFVRSSQVLHDRAWKESRGRADWVVITAVDEHLHHPDPSRYLRSCMAAGVTAVPAVGFQMVADDFPAPGALLVRDVTLGAPYFMMNKLSLFRPDAIRETGFEVGRHAAAPVGEVVYPDRDELLLLHYKYLGRAYMRERHAFLAKGLGATDRANGWGIQYLEPGEVQDAAFSGFQARAVDTGAPGFDALANPDGPRWWRAAVPPRA